MKLKRLIIALTVISLTFSLAGCGARNETIYVDSPAETDGSTVTIQAAETETETEAASEQDTTIENVTEEQTADTEPEPGWRSAYRERLLEEMAYYEMESSNQFALIYLDSDDIPELVYTDGPGAHGYYYYVCVYKDGDVIEVEGGGNVFWYYPGQGVFGYEGSGGAFIGGKSFYRLDGTQSILLDDCVYEYNSDYIETPRYTINDIEVSQEDYEGIDAEYENEYGERVEFSGFPLSKSSIMENCR